MSMLRCLPQNTGKHGYVTMSQSHLCATPKVRASFAGFMSTSALCVTYRRTNWSNEGAQSAEMWYQ